MVQIAASRPLSERAADRKRQILDAASRVFRRQGLHASGMRDVAAELDMHVGNLYYYFENKQQLLAYCQEETLAALLELAREVEDADLPADEKLRRLVVGHVERLNERIPGSLAHLEVEALEAAGRRRIQPRRDAYERAWRKLVRQGVAAGIFASPDPELTVRAILGALNWTVKWFRLDGAKSAAEIGEEMATLFLDGLGRPAATGAARSAGAEIDG